MHPSRSSKLVKPIITRAVAVAGTSVADLLDLPGDPVSILALTDRIRVNIAYSVLGQP